MQAGITPKLSDKCSKHFTYQNLIEAGETFCNSSILNLPKQQMSYVALANLAEHLLDPIVDQFGLIQISYGFCGHDLLKKISARIAPKIDQHSSYELNSLGARICIRDGAAVDFFCLSKQFNMKMVANWIIENLNFDRLYFYGNDRPLHLSWSENPRRLPYQFHTTNGGNRIPKLVKDRL